MTIPRTIPGAVCAAIRAEATLPVWQPGEREYERAMEPAIYRGALVADWCELDERFRMAWMDIEARRSSIRRIRSLRGPPE